MSTSAALMEGHYFTSKSDHRNGFSYHRAECECGEPLTWETRDTDHARHLLAVAWQQGMEALALATLAGAPKPTNPFKVEAS